MTLNISPADNNRRRNAGIRAFKVLPRFYLAKAHTKNREEAAWNRAWKGEFFSLTSLRFLSVSLSSLALRPPSLSQDRSVLRARREMDFLDASRKDAPKGGARDRQSGRMGLNLGAELPYRSSCSPLFGQLPALRNIEESILTI